MRKNPEAQEIKVGPAIHTALDELQTIDMTFNRTIVLFERQPRLNSGVILTKFAHEGSPFGNGTVESCLEPLIPRVAQRDSIVEQEGKKLTEQVF